MRANLVISVVATGLRKFSFHSNDKEQQYQSSIYDTIVLILHASKVMLKILQTRLPQNVDRDLPNVQIGFRKNRGPRNQITNIH